MAAKKKNDFDMQEILKGALIDIKNKELKSSGKVLDIISFSKRMLNLKPYISQEIILKFLYAGTRHNENIEITDNDIEIIKSWSLPNSWLLEGENSKLDILKKNKENYHKDPANNFFRDVVLILGRRSGKSLLSSLIATYEAYKLIMIPDPKQHYKDEEGRQLEGEIWIINTAITGEQAKTIVFKTIKSMVYECPLFYGRIGKETEDMLYILTDTDIKKNEKIKKEGGRPLVGSVVIACGNSNSPALRGHACSCVIYDEMAHYVNTDGSASAEEVYTALEPSCSTFYKWGDGKNIVISTPDLPNGFFYEHYNSAKTINSMLLFQIPTWDVNPNYTRESLQDKYDKNPDRAAAEYGAQFRRAGGNLYLPHKVIDEAITRRDGWYKHTMGKPGIDYYMHLDPAKNNDLWGVMVGHAEKKFDIDSRTYLTYIVEDYSSIFKADPGGFLDPDDIMDNFILPLFKKFNIVSVSSDAFFSTEQQKKFKKHRINYREISFGGVNKNKIYETMKDFFVTNRIILCNDDQELQGELKNITIKHTRRNPVIENNPSDKSYPYDDLVDCLGGIIDSVIRGAESTTKLPSSRLVRTSIR